MSTINNRYDFVIIYDVKDGNPNGDPDAGNYPRMDLETSQGLVTDVCIKRKIRDYVSLTRGGTEGYDIFVRSGSVLNDAIDEAYADLKIDTKANKDLAGNKRRKAGVAQANEVKKAQMLMCKRYFDIRTFGAVLSTGQNAGQVRGPVQLTFSRSVDPIVPMEMTVTRQAVASTQEKEKKDQTMGQKYIVPYGLYVGHGFVSARLGQGTGFSEDDLSLLWEALKNMFETDRSAARGLMSMQKLVVFRHASDLGNASAHDLFDLVEVKRTSTGPARSYSDYEVTVHSSRVPDGVEVMAL
jgi:CRISPR-associated protein Csd2